MLFIPVRISAATNTDTSETFLNRTIDIYEYYFFQSKNPVLSNAQKKKYAQKMLRLEKKILLIESERSGQKADPEEVLKNIIALFPESKPTGAYEPKSSWLSFGSSFSGFSYFRPLQVSFESSLGNKISLGGFTGFFTEVKFDMESTKKHPSYTFTKELYKYNYLDFGVRGSYHILNLEPLRLRLNSKIYDLYVTGFLGYNLAFLKPHLDNPTVPYDDPQKQGINAGAMLGLRFFPDDHFNIYGEAGYSRIAYVNIGFGYRFLPRQKKDEQPD